MSKITNHDDLNYHFKDKNIRQKCFNGFDNAIILFYKRGDSEQLTLEEAKQS